MTISLQPIPYQGSKRNLAVQIMEHMPRAVYRLVEPFAGSAAITLFSAYHHIADNFLINDSYEPLMNLWHLIIEEPETCANRYEEIWKAQLDDPNEYYFRIREEFNDDADPIKFLYLMARCAKNAVRFNSSGKFNQSPDKRRLGRRPEEMRKHVLSTSLLLNGKTKCTNLDYSAVFDMATPDDLVYMDPPYQGTSSGKNPRYHQGLDFDRFVRELEKLNDRGVPFILSFDGQLGSKIYGQPLPRHLELRHVAVNAGRSAQATLNGKSDVTIESLYLSPNLEVPTPLISPLLVVA